VAAYLFDSSAVVKRYVRETGTVWVLSITAPTAGHFIYVAHITGAEVVSALVRQARHGALPPTAVTIGQQFSFWPSGGKATAAAGRDRRRSLLGARPSWPLPEQARRLRSQAKAARGAVCASSK